MLNVTRKQIQECFQQYGKSNYEMARLAVGKATTEIPNMQ